MPPPRRFHLRAAQQPADGLYAPAQLVADARAHGVEVRPTDATISPWDNTLEGPRILRLGLRQIDGFREEWAKAMVTAREERPSPALRIWPTAPPCPPAPWRCWPMPTR
jgi:DNA polymerase III alpha subunit